MQPAGPCLVGYLAQSGATLGAGLQGAPAPAARREAASIKWVPRAPMELRCRAHGRRPTRRWEQEEALVRVVTVVAEPGVSAEAATAEVRGGTLQLQVTAKMGTYSALVTLAHPVAVEGRLPVGDALPRRWAPTHLRVRQVTAAPDTMLEGTAIVVELPKGERGTEWGELGEVVVEHFAPSAVQPRYSPCRLVASATVARNTLVYVLQPLERAAGAGPDWRFEAGQHLRMRATGPDGEKCVRSYTPIPFPAGDPKLAVALGPKAAAAVADPERPAICMLVKLYAAGAMSACLAASGRGSMLECTRALGAGLSTDFGGLDAVCLVAGGTGITPMLGVLAAAQQAGVAAHVVFCNREEQDIPLRAHLAAQCDATVHHVLSQPPQGWAGPSGRLDAAMLRTLLPSPGGRIAAFVCGPPAFSHHAAAALRQVGHELCHIFA